MVLLDTGTPGTSREIFSEDADGESTRFVTEGLRVRVSPSASSLKISPVSSRTTVLLG